MYEGFEVSVQILFELVKEAQKKSPNQKRVLYLDIEGHRNPKGGFDHDMFELQRHFILGFLMPYLTKAYIPLVAVENNKIQANDLPDKMQIFSDQKEIISFIKESIKGKSIKIYSADDDSNLLIRKD